MPEPVDPLVPYRRTIDEALAELGSDLPLHLVPQEHETSGFDMRYRQLQIDLVQVATQLAYKHGFKPETLEVTVAMRLPVKPEHITVTFTQGEVDAARTAHVYECEHQRFITRCEKGCHDEPKHASGGSVAKAPRAPLVVYPEGSALAAFAQAEQKLKSDSPCEGCGAHLAQCSQVMKDVEGRPCCRDCEHHVP